MSDESTFKAHVITNLRRRRYIYRNVMLINDVNDDRILTERAPVAIDEDNNVYLRELIVHLREQNLIQSGSSIFFYDVERDVFVHSGREPLPYNSMVPLRKFAKDEIKIKYKTPDNIHMGRGVSSAEMQLQSFQQTFAQNAAFREQQWMQSAKSDVPQSSTLASLNFCNPSQAQNVQPMVMNTQQAEEEEVNVETKAAIPREKRVKERKIGYVRERVLEWRRYYENGVPNDNGTVTKVNLDVAAGIVGLSRKTLDDYYKYIRKAEQFNFDFKLRADEKIGVLRNFVRDRQKRINSNSSHTHGTAQQSQYRKQIDEEYDEVDDLPVEEEDDEYQPKSPQRKATALPGQDVTAPSAVLRSKQQTFTLRPSTPESKSELQSKYQHFRLAPSHNNDEEENQIPAQRRMPEQQMCFEQQDNFEHLSFPLHSMTTFSQNGQQQQQSQQQYYHQQEQQQLFHNENECMDMEMDPIDLMTDSLRTREFMYQSSCNPNMTNSFDFSHTPTLMRNPSINLFPKDSHYDGLNNQMGQSVQIYGGNNIYYGGASPQEGIVFDQECDFINEDETNYRQDFFNEEA